MSTPRIVGLLALAAALGCAGGRTRPAAAPAGDPQAAAAAEAVDVASARAQRLFGEAVRTEAEQRKQQGPMDWPLLERRWRAVLDAADLPEARYNLGVALEAQGRLGEARAEYERARAAKPELRQASVNLGVLLEKQGDPRGAQAIYAEVVRDFPEDARARERLAALYLATGQLDASWSLAREALLREPRSVGAYKVMVRVAQQRGNLDLAKLVALRAQKLDEKDPELPHLVGQVLAKQGDDAGAAAQQRRALALAPGFLPARHALLEAAVKSEAWKQVAEHAAALLEAEPRNAALQLTHGVALRHLGRADEALAAYDRAHALSGGKLAEVHLARGVLHMRVKNACEPAVEEFRAFVEAAGPAAATSTPVLKLQRECEQILDENRRALEAAREMQREAERKAEEAAGKAKEGEAPTATGAGDTAPGRPTSPPNPSR